MKPISSALQTIKQAFGLTPSQASALEPDMNNAGVGFGYPVTFDADGETWAEAEYRKEHAGWKSLGRVDKSHD